MARYQPGFPLSLPRPKPSAREILLTRTTS